MAGNKITNPNAETILPNVETILLVDDELELLRVNSRLLTTLGYQILSAKSGPEALDVLLSHDVDLIVLDMLMPGMDGVETLRQIRELRPDQKVVILSAYAEPEKVEEVKKLGVLAYLKKPLSLKTMTTTLRSALDGHQNEDMTSD